MRRRTTAITVAGAGSRFAVEEVALDAPAPDEVLVRVDAVGMCHADLAVRAGEFPFPLPGVPGHEGAGVVEEVGSAVTSLRPGDRVMLTFDSCGSCRGCVSGVPSQCSHFVEYNFTDGARPDGSSTQWRGDEPLHGSFFGESSFAGYALAHERNAIAVPPSASEVGPELLAPLGCGVQTGAGAVLNVPRPRLGSTLAVFGAGVVGLCAVMAAALLPLRELVVVDVQQSIGVPPFGVTAPIDVAGMVNNSKNIHGVVEGRSNPPTFLVELPRLVASGRLPVGTLVTTFPLERAEHASEQMVGGAAVKPVLVPEHGTSGG